MNDDSSPSGADTRYYDATYGGSDGALEAAIRRDAFGEDIGQFSWLTADEYRRFFTVLGLAPSSDVLEVACGSGGPALFLAGTVDCRITGVDIHAAGVDGASRAAGRLGMQDKARFLLVDAREPLPFTDESFDAIVCIDAINHMYERGGVLAEWRRVLRPGGRALFTDPIVVTGMIRREEMVIRSGAMGEFVFTAPGVDEALMREAGFDEIHVEDVTANMADVARRWHDARERRADELARTEDAHERSDFQRFLAVVEALAGERRLSRLAITGRRPSG